MLTLLAALFPRAVTAQQRATVYVEVSYIRPRPSMNEAVTGVVIKGETVTVLERTGVWARISAGRKKGWMRASGLTTNPPNADGSAVPSSGPSMATSNGILPRTEAASVSARPSGDQSGARGFSIGVLGTAIGSSATSSTPSAYHVVASPLILIQGSRLGAYLAPELGAGAGYRSTMLGAGATVRVMTIERVDLRVLAGYANYSEVSDADTRYAARPRRSVQGASAGALLSLRLAGSLRLAVRGEYVAGLGTSPSLRFQRFAVGVVK